MKFLHFLSLAAATTALFLTNQSASAGVAAINTPSSNGTVNFDDTASFDAFLTPGTLFTTVNSPAAWVGAAFGIPLTTAPITGDTVRGGMSASFSSGTTTYGFALNAVKLEQLPANSGQAVMRFSFNIEYDLDGAGFSTITPTFVPTFNLDGTVTGTGFANFSGGYQVVSTLLNASLDGVTYNFNTSVPGSFTASVPGVATNGFLPPLPAFDRLIYAGGFTFTVDPATINASTAPVPEPATGLLVGLALPYLLARRRPR